MEILLAIFRTNLQDCQNLQNPKKPISPSISFLFPWPIPPKSRKGCLHGPFLPIHDIFWRKVQVDLSVYIRTVKKWNPQRQCFSVFRFWIQINFSSAQKATWQIVVHCIEGKKWITIRPLFFRANSKREWTISKPFDRGGVGSCASRRNRLGHFVISNKFCEKRPLCIAQQTRCGYCHCPARRCRRGCCEDPIQIVRKPGFDLNKIKLSQAFSRGYGLGRAFATSIKWMYDDSNFLFQSPHLWWPWPYRRFGFIRVFRFVNHARRMRN